MKIKVPKRMTMQKFLDWIRENTHCEVQIQNQNRVNVVVFADNIEPGKCVPLYAQKSLDKILICEFSGDCRSPQEAWQALEDPNADRYPPQPFHDWVMDQYLTAKNVRVEKFAL